MDYTVLTSSKSTAGSLKNWINRDTTDPDTILTEAQALIYTSLRHWRMKTEASGSLTINQSYLDLPSDFVDARVFRLTGNYAARLRRGDEMFVQGLYGYDASGNRVQQTPVWFYLGGNGGTPRAYFDAAPDLSSYGYLLSYFQKPADLSGSNTTNWLTSFYPRLLRTACMLIATEFEKEVGQGQFDRTYWQQQLTAQLADVQAKSDIVERASDAPVEFA